MRLSIIKFQLKNIIQSPSILVSMFILLLATLIILIQELIGFWGNFVTELPSAAIAWIANYESMRSYLWAYAIIFLIPCIVSTIAGESYYRDKKFNRLLIIQARSGSEQYFLSQYITILIVSFLFIFIYMLFTQLIMFIFFPINNSIDSYQLSSLTTAADFGSYEIAMQRMPFGFASNMSPYLFNILYSIYDSSYISAVCLLVYSVSLFIPLSGVAIIGLPSIMLMIGAELIPSRWNPIVNLLMSFSRSSQLDLLSMLIVPLILVLVSCILFIINLFLVRDTK